MKVCCENIKSLINMSEIEKLGCHHDHCTGAIEVSNYWEPNLSQGNHFTQEDVIIGNLLSYIANQAYEADRFGYFLKNTKPYCKFNLDTMLPEVLEYKITEEDY